MSKEESTKEDAPKKKGKLPLIIGAVVVLLALGGGGWFYMNQSKSKGKEDGHAEGKSALESAREHHSKKASAFVNLDPFTFNLLDDDQDRFAQIGIVLEVADAAVEGELKKVEPAIRNSLLMLLTSKTSRDLLSVDGKLDLAYEMVEATNAILAGEPPPEIRVSRPKAPKRKNKLILKRKDESHGDSHNSPTPEHSKGHDDSGAQEKSDQYADERSGRSRRDRGYDEDNSHDDDRGRRRRSARRAPIIPERVYTAHFSQFLIQ